MRRSSVGALALGLAATADRRDSVRSHSHVSVAQYSVRLRLRLRLRLSTHTQPFRVLVFI